MCCAPFGPPKSRWARCVPSMGSPAVTPPCGQTCRSMAREELGEPRHLAHELGARAQPELAVGVAEVKLDGLGAEEQRRRGLLVGGSVGHGERDLELLRRERVQ